MVAKKRKRRNYTLTFKKQIVQLYQNGKSKADISKEYDVHISVIERWLSQYDNSGSFKEKENRSEFNNYVIDQALETFKISRSLSRKGNSYDNAVAESTFKIFKTEFINNSIFSTLNELEVELADYINWFNNHRIHSTLGYLSPVEFLKNKLKKLSKFLLPFHSIKIW